MVEQELVSNVTDLIRIYRRTSYYKLLLKFCLYELAIYFYFLKTSRTEKNNLLNSFYFANSDISKEFMKRIRYHIRNLARKVEEVDDFNYCCSRFVVEPLSANQIKGLGDRVATELKLIINSPYDNIGDAIIGTMYNL